MSVILTFYNNVDYVESAFQQLKAVVGDPFELIVTDDGSTDGTREALRERVSAFPGARLLEADGNIGIASIRNWAAQTATAEYIWFLDCDDVWAPDALDRLRSLVAGGGIDIGMVHAERVTGGGERGKLLEDVPSGTYRDEALQRQILTGGVRGYLWNKLIRRDLLLSSPFPLRRAQEDFAVISELAFSGASLSSEAQVKYWHVERTGSITNSRVESFDDLLETHDRVLELVSESRFASQLSAAGVFFTQWYLRSSVVNTSIRLGLSSTEAELFVSSVRRSVSWSDVRTTWAFSRREGAIAALIKGTGATYPAVYRAYLKRRSP